MSNDSEETKAPEPKKNSEKTVTPAGLAVSRIILLCIILAVMFFGRIVEFFVDMQWFESTGHASVFWNLFWGKLMSGLFMAALWLVPAGLNLYLLGRLRRSLPLIIRNGVIEHPKSAPSLSFPAWITAIVSLFMFSWGVSSYESFMCFFNRHEFGVADPVFNFDASFYVFSLPFIRNILAVLFGGVLGIILLDLFFYLFMRGRDAIPVNFNLPVPIKKHVLGCFSYMFVVFACWLFFERFGFLCDKDALVTRECIVNGVLFTDLYGRIPCSLALVILSLLCAVFVFGDLKTKNWRHVAVSFGGFFAALFLLLYAYPFVLQKFFVAPSELTKERPFIERNITATRTAFGLDRFRELSHPGNDSLSLEKVKRNGPTIRNIRMWDDKPLLEAYSELQEIRTYYEFFDVDFDRYVVDGEYRQTMISPRELSAARIPDRKWINETFTYTHGYGACMGPVNCSGPDGLPEFFIKDIPPVSKHGLKIDNPAIYYGEITDGYRIVNSNESEFDYPSGDDNIYCSYKGKGGVKIGGILNRLLFSSYFGDIKILISSEIRDESRILFHRRIAEMAGLLTPFVSYDADPYMVVSEGRLYWMMDGFTTSSKYPYSEKFDGVNYVRNSVKVVADAFNGTMSFYVSEPDDPIIKTCSSAFPGLFRPISEMPGDLRKHLRYPESMLKLQASVYARYHMTDVKVFYNQEDLWKISSAKESDENSTYNRGRGAAHDGMNPYYTILKLPGRDSEKEEFVLMLPFSPARKANMISLIAARCDEPHYGEVSVFEFPKDKLIFGPQQIDSRIDQDPEISKQLTLWTQGGSNAVRGKLLVIPIEDSLLYVEPLFLAASSGKIPQLKKVFVVCGDKVAMEDNLESALEKVFSGGTPGPSIADPVKSKPQDPLSIGTGEESVRSLVLEASEHLERAKRAQRNDDWAVYGSEMKALGKSLDALRGKIERDGEN